MYEDEFANDMREGQARCTFSSGNVILGNYYNDKRIGHGHFLYATGEWDFKGWTQAWSQRVHI